MINRFASHALEEITSKAISFKTDKHWKDFQKKIKETTTIDAQVPATLDAELRPYQEEGFRWMTRLKTWDAGACLADDMGLGKTVQAIAMMLHLAENGPMLVVCPASVVPNWGSELRKFAPTLNPIILRQGNREEASAMSRTAAHIGRPFAHLRIERLDQPTRARRVRLQRVRRGGFVRQTRRAGLN